MYFRHPNSGRIRRPDVTELDNNSAIPAGDGFWALPDVSLSGSATLSLSGSGNLVKTARLGSLTLSISASGIFEKTSLSGGATVDVSASGRLAPFFKGGAVLSLTGDAVLENTPLANAVTLSVTAAVQLEEISLQSACTISISSSGNLYVVRLSEVSLTWPSWSLTATGESSGSTAELTWPARSLTAYSGGSAALTWPVWSLTAAGTVERVGTAELTWPTWVLSAEGLTGGIGSVELTWPDRMLTAFGGGHAELTWPARTLAAAGTLEVVGTAELTWPQWSSSATGLTGGIGTAALTWPTWTLAAAGLTGGVGTIALRWPTLTITATDSGATTETTYAVNLSTGAVTQLLLGAFDKMIAAHGRLYGLQNGDLICLNGSSDDGTDISTTVRFAQQTFGSNHVKRANTVYLHCREDDGIKLTLIQDETRSWAYQTSTDTAPSYGTHKIKVGRGIPFHTMGLILQNRNGGRMDIGGMEILAEELSRRPR